jgi:hypothetical protein
VGVRTFAGLEQSSAASTVLRRIGLDYLRLQAALRELLRVESEDEIRASFFGTNTECIVLGVGRYFGRGAISIDPPRSRMKLMSVPIAADRTCNSFRTSLYAARISSEYSHTKCSSFAQRWSRSALGIRPATYWSRKPEMPATTTLVSTTARCFRFPDFGCNGDLRDADFLTITANRALDLFFGDPSYIFVRL